PVEDHLVVGGGEADDLAARGPERGGEVVGGRDGRRDEHDAFEGLGGQLFRGGEHDAGAAAAADEVDGAVRRPGLHLAHEGGELLPLPADVDRVLQVVEVVAGAVRPAEGADLVRHAGGGPVAGGDAAEQVHAADAVDDEDEAGLCHVAVRVRGPARRNQG